MSDFSEIKDTAQDVNDQIIFLIAQMRSHPSRANEAFRKLCALCESRLLLLAKRYARYGVPADELQQVGRLAIWNCISKFDETRAVLFWTFAEIYIRGAMCRSLHRDRMIRVPAAVQDKIYKMAQCVEKLVSQLGRTPTVEEIGREMEWSEQEINFLLLRAHAFQLQSIEENADQGKEAEISDTYFDDQSVKEAAMAFLHSLPAEADKTLFSRYLASLYAGEERNTAVAPLGARDRKQIDKLLGSFGKYLHENGYINTPLTPGSWSSQRTIDPELEARMLALRQAGLTYKEIAEAVGGTEGGVKVWFHRHNRNNDKLKPISLQRPVEPEED